MKVKIGPYRNWIGPYQIADWFKPIFGEERIDRFTDSEFFEKVASKVQPFLEWIDRKKHRTIKVKLHPYDSYSACDTMTTIILPLLIDLRDRKQGSPGVDQEDLPEWLREEAFENRKDQMIHNELIHEQWKWVLDEMIWAFDQMDQVNRRPNYNDWEMLYCQQLEEGERLTTTLYRLTNNPAYLYANYDNEAPIFTDGYKEHNARIQRGTELFGKYFRNLWR